MSKEKVFENTPIILKDYYEVNASEVMYTKPVLDEYGNIVCYKEISKEEYNAWTKG